MLIPHQLAPSNFCTLYMKHKVEKVEATSMLSQEHQLSSGEKAAEADDRRQEAASPPRRLFRLHREYT
jgi:hypothetical protein